VKQRRILLLGVVLALIAAFATSGCRRVKLSDTPGGAGATDQAQTVPLDGATTLATSVSMGLGALKVSSTEPSSALALDATFSYPAAFGKPKVAYSTEASRGTLSVRQVEAKGPPSIPIGGNDSEWRLRLARDIPTDLVLDLGVGESNIDLRNVDVTSLKIDCGVGQTKLNLSGARERDLRVSVNSGVGEVDITVPRDVGVRLVSADEGLGEISAQGFTKDGGGLVNSAWGNPGPKIEIALSTGVGEIKVTQAE